MKDLKLEVGDKCYIGQDEWELKYHNKEHYTITRGGFCIDINMDGSLYGYFNSVPTIVSIEPYEFPEMVYDKPFEKGEVCYFWDDHDLEESIVICGKYKYISNSNRHWANHTENDGFDNCSRTNPLNKNQYED